METPLPEFITYPIGDVNETPVAISTRMRHYLHNLKVETMNAKINLRFDPKQPEKFLQEDATLVGQLNLLEQIMADTQPSEDH